MASYTDAISQFNPYIQQLPVELMAKVGMQKQAQYDQGVQKIQQSIDNVAGLDIYSNVDKKHLESKMNELGNRLRTVAAGDFSNQQLVNSTAGMTGSIIKDPIVQAAVQSTAHIKSQFEKIKQLEKKGLTDKNNDNFFADRLNTYANRKDLTDASGNVIKFGEDYAAYTNFSKVLKEELGGAGLDEKTIEQLFETENGLPKKYSVPIMGKDGKQAVDKTGKPLFDYKYKYADVKSIEKIGSNRVAVEAAIQNVFRRGDVKKQLEIDGWANYRNTDVETLLNPLTDKHEDIDSLFDQQKLELVSLMNADNISDQEKAALEEQVKNLDSQRSESEKQFATLYKFAQDDPEAFKQNYYETSVKNDLMKEFLKENVSKTFGTNEAKVQQNRDQDYAFKILQENNQTSYQNATLANSNANTRIAQAASNLALRTYLRDTVIDPVTGKETKAPDPNKAGKLIKPDDLSIFKGGNPGEELPPNYAINMINDDITTLAAGKSKEALTLYTDMYKRVYPKQNLTPKQIADNIASHTALHNKNNPNDKITKEQFLFRTVDGIQNKYIEKGLTFTPNDKARYNAYVGYTDELNRDVQLTARLADETWKEIGAENKGAPVALKNVTAEVGGKQVVITPEDQKLFYLAYGEITPAHPLYRADQSFFSGLPGTEVNKKRGEAITTLRNKYGAGFTEGFSKALGNFAGGVPSLGGADNQKFNELFNEKLKKVVGVSDVTAGSLPWTEATEREDSKANLITYLSSADAKSLGGASKEEVLGAITDAAAVSWVGKKPTTFREDWTGKFVITTKADNTGIAKQYIIDDVNKEDLETLGNIELGDYERKPVQMAIRSNPKTQSTNSQYQITSPDAWKGAFLKENRIDPSIQKAGWLYRADAVDAAEGGGYRMIHYIKPPDGKFTTIYGQTIINSDKGVEESFGKTNIQILQSTLSNYLQNQKK